MNKTLFMLPNNTKLVLKIFKGGFYMDLKEKKVYYNNNLF